MSDLIDRNRLILSLNDYALQESPVHDGEDRTVYETIQECIKAVEEQPTAYDPEKEKKELIEKVERLSYVKYHAKFLTEFDDVIDILKGKEVKLDNEPTCKHCGAYLDRYCHHREQKVKGENRTCGNYCERGTKTCKTCNMMYKEGRCELDFKEVYNNTPACKSWCKKFRKKKGGK